MICQINVEKEFLSCFFLIKKNTFLQKKLEILLKFKKIVPKTRQYDEFH